MQPAFPNSVANLGAPLRVGLEEVSLYGMSRLRLRAQVDMGRRAGFRVSGRVGFPS